MKKIYLTILLLTLLLVMCKESEEESIMALNVIEISDPAKIAIEDFIIDIDTIRLETSDESIITDIIRMQVIETAFRALKTSGFNIEHTHLTAIDRIEKLLAIVLIAFVWAYKVGIYLHLNVKEIKIKKHQRKAKSIFRYGLDYIKTILLNPCRTDRINVFNFLSCT